MHRRERSRITLSIKQLEEDPLLETLETVIRQVWTILSVVFLCIFIYFYSVLVEGLATHCCKVTQDASVSDDYLNNSYEIEPLPGLETIIQELLREDGYENLFPCLHSVMEQCIFMCI